MAHRNAPLRLRFAEGELTVSAQSQDVGETASRCRPRTRASRSRSASTPSSSRDGIDSVEGDDVRLKLISPLRPGLITSAEDDSSGT